MMMLNDLITSLFDVTGEQDLAPNAVNPQGARAAEATDLHTEAPNGGTQGPNSSLKTLIEMGFVEEDAEQALEQTASVEEATSLFERHHPEPDPNLDPH
jgi:hypothetical protein